MSTITQDLDFSQPQLTVKFVDAGHANGAAGVIEGWASTFGDPPDRVGDIVKAGAFGDEAFTVPLLAFHDPEKPIGQATITPKAEGAWLSATLANTPFAQEMRELVKAGAVPSLSIGYQTKASEPNDYGGEDIYKLDLMEVSLVPIPANPNALITTAKAFSPKDKKLYIDAGITGSYEDVQGELRNALRAQYGGNAWVSLVATFADHVIYEVEQETPSATGDTVFSVTYMREGEGITLGTPAPVDVTVAISPKALVQYKLKAGRRNSNKDQGALNSAHDAIVTAGAFCPGAEDAPEDAGKNLDIDVAILDLESKTL